MARYKCNEEMHNRCENSALCHICDGSSLYKNTAEIKKQKREQKEVNKQAEKDALLKTYHKEKKEGMGFEKKVAGAWNKKFEKSKKKVAKPRLDMMMEDEPVKKEVKITGYQPPVNGKPIGLPPKAKPSIQKPEAKRQINSGAMWHSKGDIKLEHALMECKERGTTNARGQKQITIPKDWLEKQAKEAFQEQRPYWYLPFGYKGDDEVYLIKPYDHELELVYELRKAREEIERLEKELEARQ